MDAFSVGVTGQQRPLHSPAFGRALIFTERKRGVCVRGGGGAEKTGGGTYGGRELRRRELMTLGTWKDWKKIFFGLVGWFFQGLYKLYEHSSPRTTQTEETIAEEGSVIKGAGMLVSPPPPMSYLWTHKAWGSPKLDTIHVLVGATMTTFMLLSQELKYTNPFIQLCQKVWSIFPKS